jgi:hypothetical protein
MPCLLALLAVAFPRVAIVLLWLFTNFFAVLRPNILIPILGFLFLPLTLIVYTYILHAYAGHMGITQLIFIFIAVVVDLGLVGGGALRNRN